MDIITIEKLKSLQKGEMCKGIILLKNYQKCTAQSSGNTYIKGLLHSKADFQLIVWNKSVPFQMMCDYQDSLINRVVEVEFEVIDFAGKLSASLSHLRPVDGISEDEFLEIKYPIKGYQKKTLEFLQENLSEDAYKLFCKIFEVDTGEESVWERFSRAYAASTHHDNCRSGLLAHNYKLLLLAKRMVTLYPWLGKVDQEDKTKSQTELDIFYLSTISHDIGKIDEMYDGVYMPDSFITHRILGLEYLFKYKEDIERVLGHRGYLMLQSVMVGHHDDYGDKAKSIYAKVVHKIDELDALLTGIGQELEASIMETSAGKSIRLSDGYYQV